MRQLFQALILLAAVGFPLNAYAQVILVRNGEARAVVVTADEPTPTASYAAQELVWHVERATGVNLPIVSESEVGEDAHTRVYIGDTKTVRAVGINPDRLPREAYTMRSLGNDLFIVGREDGGDPLNEYNPNSGTLFGVYEFLGRFVGVRWLWPGELGTYVPATDTVEIWSINETSSPALNFRGFYWGIIRSVSLGNTELSEEHARLGFSPEVAREYGKALQVMLRRHRMGGQDIKPPSGHLFSGWWKRYGKEHPEWFGLRRDGTRGHPDPEYGHVAMCVSNPELHDFIIEQWDGSDKLLLGPVDRPGRCICTECQAWDGPQPDPIPWFAEGVYKTDRRAQEVFSGATSDRYARFWKTIQEKASKRNPNVLVSASFIYENEFPAPVTGIKLNSNIYGEFVQWQDPHLRWFPMPDEAFQWIKDQWTGWRETGIRISYRPNYLHDGYVMPHFETSQSGEFFKFAYEHGMEGAVFDSLTGQWATQGPRNYMHMRLMTDPTLELDAIWEEYCSAFGPAAETMREYFDYWEQYAFDNVLNFIDLYRGVGWRYSSYVRRAHAAFPPECFGPAEALLERALREAETANLPEFAERVRFIQIGLQHAQLATAMTAAFDGEEEVPEANSEEARKAVAALVRFRKQHERTFFSDLYHATSYWERTRLNIDLLTENLQ